MKINYNRMVPAERAKVFQKFKKFDPQIEKGVFEKLLYIVFLTLCTRRSVKEN